MVVLPFLVLLIELCSFLRKSYIVQLYSTSTAVQLYKKYVNVKLTSGRTVSRTAYREWRRTCEADESNRSRQCTPGSRAMAVGHGGGATEVEAAGSVHGSRIHGSLGLTERQECYM